MTILGKSFMFEVEEKDEDEDRECNIEESEQNLEEEATRMLQSWDRDHLMREVKTTKESNPKYLEQDCMDFYNGETEFKDMFPDMEEHGGGMVYFKKLKSNPEGREIRLNGTVRFDSVGYLEFNPIPFESSFHEGKPNVWNLTERILLPGWEAVLTMLREGESANFILHPAVAYGKLGAPPLIPGDSFIFWHIKIHNSWEESMFDRMIQFEKDTHVDLPIDERISLIEEHKQIANEYLRDGKFRDALIRYKAAIKYIELLASDDEGLKLPTLIKLRALLYQNAAITFNKLNMHKSATKAAKNSLNSDPSNLKAYFQLIKARIALDDHINALRYLDVVKKIAPDNVSFNYLRIQVDSKSLKEREERDKIMKRMGMAFV